MLSTQKSIKKNIFINFFRTFLTLVFPLITFPYASRVLMPDGLGKINFSISIVSYFTLIASLGIPIYAAREVSKRRDNKNELNLFFSEIFLINIISTIISYLLLIFATVFIKKLSDYSLIIFVCSFLIIFNTLGVEWLYTGMEDFLYITIRSFVFQCISLILLFVLVKTKDDILKYAFISVFSSAGSNICNFIHSRKYVSFVKIDRLFFKKHLKPIIIFCLSFIANSIYTMLDTVMLGWISGDESVGYYTAATKINRMVLSMILTISTVMLPRISYLRAKENEDEYRTILNKSLSFMLLLACPCVVGLEILSKTIITLLSGEQYIPAVVTMKIMNPIIFIVCIGNFFGMQVLLPNNKEKLNLIIISIAACINLIFNSILIPFYSANGAAVGSIIAELFVAICSFVFGLKFINYKVILRNTLKYIFNSVIMGAIVLIVSFLIDYNFIKLIISVVVGILVYVILLFIEKDTILLDVIHSLNNKVKKINNN